MIITAPTTTPPIASKVWYPSKIPSTKGVLKVDGFTISGDVKKAIEMIISKIKTIMGVKNLPIKPMTLERFTAKIKTNKKYTLLVNNALVPKKGWIAISWVTEAVLGDGIAMEII